jgi:MFS family permease
MSDPTQRPTADSVPADAGDARQPAGDAPYPSALYAWFLVAVLVLASLVSFVDRQVIAIVVEPMKADLGASDSEIGLLYGVFAVFYALAGLPIAYLADRTRRTWLIAAGVFVWSLMTMVSGVARTFTHVLLARIGVGIGEATLTPTAISLVSDTFPRRSIPLALSVYQTGAILGSGLAFIIGGVVLGLVERAPPMVLPYFGELRPWQQTFIYVGAPGLLLAVLLLAMREPVRRQGAAPKASADDVAASFRALAAHYARHRWTLLLHHFGFLSFNLLGYAFVFWTVSFFTRVHGMDAASASLTFGWIFLIAGPLGSVWAGFMARQFALAGRPDATILAGLIGGTLTLPFILAIQVMPSATWAFVLYVPAMFFVNSPFGVANGALPLITPPPLRAQVGAVNMLVGALGMMLGPPIAGVFNEQVFPGTEGVRYSVATVTLLFGSIGFACLWACRRHYARSVREVEALGG